MNRQWLEYGAILLLMLVLLGCSGGSSETPIPEPAASGLTRFRDCQELASYLRDSVSTEQQLSATYIESGTGVQAPAMDTTNSSQTSIPVDYTTTNVQEAGVDEPDFVKTDGQYLYLIRGTSFLIFSAWPAESTTEIARLELAGSPFALFLYQDRVVVLSHNYASSYPALATDFAPVFQGALQLSLYDVSDRTSPRLTRTIDLEGAYVDARLIAGHMHLVLSSGGGALVYAGVPLSPGTSDPGSATDLVTGLPAAAVAESLDAFPTFPNLYRHAL